MNTRILKKIRKFRVLSGLLIMFLTLLSFQNCAPPMNDCANGGSKCSSDGSSSSPSTDKGSIWDSRPGGSGAVTVGGGGGGGSSNYGGGGTGGGITVGSGGGSSGGGGVSTGGGTGGSNTAFRIRTQPQGVTVLEGARFNLEVVVEGGTAPYSYQWYKDSKVVGDGFGIYSFFTDIANDYLKEGTYHVEIKDATGQSLKSTLARVSIQEPAVGCEKGSYFTFTKSTYDTAYNYFGQYFDGPRGKFLLHSSYDTLNVLYNYSSYAQLSSYNTSSKLDYLQKTTMSCRTTIPRIHTPATNPGYSGYYDVWTDPYADSYQWIYTGTITFECHNKKLKLISNTCKWAVNPNYNPYDYGG